ncbi:MAG: hypothetical protein HY614_06815 [Candidatus Rokubacteria bacterium]|nr:hypothetical protein [Candidatus Rokubacteria bacterium]
MSPAQERLGQAAQRLARNPLGIIALFIVLVYGIAALVVNYSAGHLDQDQKWPLVWFLVGFPVAVLTAFTWLVARHHTKLYAPGDYREDRGFFEAMSSGDQRRRLDKEVAVLREAHAGDASPEQRVTPAAIIANENLLRAEYVLAEELALRAVELELGVRVQRNVRTSAGREFDGVFIDKYGWHGVEVKLVPSHRGRSVAEGIMNWAQALARGHAGDKPAGIVIVLVFRDDFTPNTEAAVRNEIAQRMGGVDMPVRVLLYSYSDLARRFGVEKAT